MGMLELATRIARVKYDGHFTLMKFTTGYRFCFGTMDYHSDYMKWREIIRDMPEGKTLDEAISKAIIRELR